MEWKPTETGSTARQLMRRSDSGVLSSMSSELPGYPFGSLTPYVLTHGAQLVLYVSAIAQHTVNMKADPHACITVIQGGQGNAQAQARVTLVGDGVPVPESDLPEVEQRYFAFFPEARAYGGTHAFAFYQLVPRRVRYIGGFGKIFWVEAEDWRVPRPEWASEEQRILEHMNADHRDAMLRMAEQHAGLQSSQAEMIACDAEGCHLRLDESIEYIAFPRPCMTLDAVRAGMRELARGSG